MYPKDARIWLMKAFSHARTGLGNSLVFDTQEQAVIHTPKGVSCLLLIPDQDARWHLYASPLPTLPDDLASLPLIKLRAMQIGFAEVPPEIAQLPHGCEVEVCGNPLSEAIRGNFARICEAGGPHIQFMVDEGLPVEFMDQTADFKNEQTRPHLKQRMRHLLSDLTRMLETRGDTQLAAYLGIAEEATSSCRDRIAIGLNNMELQQVNFRASKGELSIKGTLSVVEHIWLTLLKTKLQK